MHNSFFAWLPDDILTVICHKMNIVYVKRLFNDTYRTNPPQQYIDNICIKSNLPFTNNVNGLYILACKTSIQLCLIGIETSDLRVFKGHMSTEVWKSKLLWDKFKILCTLPLSKDQQEIVGIIFNNTDHYIKGNIIETLIENNNKILIEYLVRNFKNIVPIMYLEDKHYEYLSTFDIEIILMFIHKFKITESDMIRVIIRRKDISKITTFLSSMDETKRNSIIETTVKQILLNDNHKLMRVIFDNQWYIPSLTMLESSIKEDKPRIINLLVNDYNIQISRVLKRIIKKDTPKELSVIVKAIPSMIKEKYLKLAIKCCSRYSVYIIINNMDYNKQEMYEYAKTRSSLEIIKMLM